MKKDELENFVQALKDLPEKIGLVKSYEVGVDSLKSPYSFDVVLISTYNSMEDLFKYKEHDAHDEFAEYMRSVCMPIKAVDFEF